MFLVQLMVAADYVPLEQAPDGFDGMGMHVAAHPLLRFVVNGLMLGVAKIDTLIHWRKVRIDALRIRRNVLLQKVANRFSIDTLSTFNRSGPPHSITPMIVVLFPV